MAAATTTTSTDPPTTAGSNSTTLEGVERQQESSPTETGLKNKRESSDQQQQIGNNRPSPLDTTTLTGSNNDHMSSNFQSGMSPSTHSSAQSSSIFGAPSTAGTSPISNFHLHHHHNNNLSSIHAHNNINNNPLLGFNNNSHSSHQNPHAVTRILHLSGFPKELKTRDIQLVFSEWEDERGGFKIKWIDDTSCLIVFADPGVAKRAFVSVLSNPPKSLIEPGDPDDPKQIAGRVAKLRAYNGPDVPHILASVQNRPRSRSNASQSLHSRASSMASNHNNVMLGRKPSLGAMASAGLRTRASMSSASGQGLRQGLNSINPSNPAAAHHAQDIMDQTNLQETGSEIPPSGGGMRARIDDAGKRFIAAGLGKPNGSFPSLSLNPNDDNNSISYSLAEMTIEEEALTPTATSHRT